MAIIDVRAAVLPPGPGGVQDGRFVCETCLGRFCVRHAKPTVPSARRTPRCDTLPFSGFSWAVCDTLKLSKTIFGLVNVTIY